MDFSPLEILFLKTKKEEYTDYEMAELLQIPVEHITKKTAELCGGEEIRKQEEIDLLNKRADPNFKKKNQARELREKERQKKKAEKELAKQKKKEQIERIRQIRAEDEKRARNRKRAEESSRFQTRQVDLSKMRSVRIDNKTIVFLKDGQDEAEVVIRYKKLLNKH